jgi:hypothetical protein
MALASFLRSSGDVGSLARALAISFHMPGVSKPFLEGYHGQTVLELIAMKETYRVDSLVLAVEQAVGRKPPETLTEAERVVLAVEAMEREVNNGGYHQFFFNSGEFTGFLVRALELIGCPNAAAISADAIAVLELPEGVDRDAVQQQVAFELSDEAEERLNECDSRYFGNDEDIEQQLFGYIEQNQHEIQIPYVV